LSSALLPGLARPHVPDGYSLLLSGPTGAGKSSYSLGFINEGLRAGGKGIIVAFDIPKERVLESAKDLGYDLTEHGSDLMILDYFSQRPDTLHDVSIALHKTVDDCCKKGRTRIVVDSLSTLALLTGHDSIPPWVLQQRTRLSRLPSLTLFCYDPGVHPPTLKLTLQNILDGTIELRLDERDGRGFERYFRISNLRGIGHTTGWSRFEIIQNEGIRFL